MFVTSQTIAFAYPSPPATAKVTSGCANVTQGNNCTYAFEFVDSGGNGVDGLSVTFALDPVSGCSLSPASGTTSGGGFVSTALSCASNASGSGSVVATSGTVSASAAVNVNAANAGGGGTLPFTSTNPPGPNGWLIAGLTLAGAIMLAGASYLTLNRRRRTPA
ncbi:MAG: hypothetical protein JOZ75_14110 [Candidatus Dormibacteraeota bacterium]|nr:hypothetical protein [Candidatus Dormibacteraeota bacterium]